MTSRSSDGRVGLVRLMGRHSGFIACYAALAATGATDESGNARLSDIGLHLRSEISRHFADQGSPLTCKYLDPAI